ncbi:hypothetical protein VNO77_15595 [Canavalia gladiata]|uniref:Uncharacterized protein n=1 Tax=Canavalia gladiata TaxID=3824 RepID=A0AAN9M0F1_CANGL
MVKGSGYCRGCRWPRGGHMVATSGYDLTKTVNKMDGEIKIVKKEDQGTMMQLYLHLSTPTNAIEQHCQVNFANKGLMMQKMDGYEVTKAIRKSKVGIGLHIPIVVLTAHAISYDEAKWLKKNN